MTGCKTWGSKRRTRSQRRPSKLGISSPLRIHVQSIEGDGSSDAYILITTVVPVLEAVLPGMLGLGLVGVKLRKFA